MTADDRPEAVDVVPPPALSRRRRVIGVAAGILAVAFLVVSIASSADAVSSYDWEISPPAAIAGFLGLLAVYAATAFGYVLILEELVQHRVDRRRFLAIWGRSMIARYVPGNVLMVATRMVLGGESGVPGRVSFTATVYEQVLNLAACAVGAGLMLLVYGTRSAGVEIWLVAVVPASLVLLHPRILGALLNWLLRRLGREQLVTLMSVRRLIAMFAWYGATATLMAVSVGLLVHGVAGADAGDLLYVGLSFLASFVLSMLAFVFPSGLGVREGAFALALSRDVPLGVGIAIATGVRLVVTAAELVFVGAAVAADRLGRSAPATGAGGDEQPEEARTAAEEQRVDLQHDAEER
jgi:glycosyltransferase 2 family protein